MTEQMKQVAAFLIERSYTRDESKFTLSHLKEFDECEVFFKRNSAPCETNDNAQFRIRASRYLPEHSVLLELSIRSENDSKWWDLRVYNLSFEQVQQELEQLEERLVRFFVPEKRKVYSLLAQEYDEPAETIKIWFDKPNIEEVQKQIGEGKITDVQYQSLFFNQPVIFYKGGAGWWIDVYEE
jgi:hypothetical protein